MKLEDKLCLARIRARYGTFISVAAAVYDVSPEVLAGIMLRETRGGESKWLDVPGPGGKGDGGHGHGLMQIDDRSFPGFTSSDDWRDPEKNIRYGARVLDSKRRYLSQAGVPDDILERASIAAYNCGEGNVLKVYRAGEDLDARTAGHDYSRYVLEASADYAALEPVKPPEPEPVPEPPKGFWALMFGFIADFFRRKDKSNVTQI